MNYGLDIVSRLNFLKYMDYCGYIGVSYYLKLKAMMYTVTFQWTKENNCVGKVQEYMRANWEVCRLQSVC